jgi:protein-tyrosine phosphatase
MSRGLRRSLANIGVSTSVSQMSEIVPGLFVGSKPDPGRHSGVDVIVLAALEYQPSAELFPGVEVIHVPLDDAPNRLLRNDEIADATEAGSRVARRLRAGRRVLVSCQMGLNRSALIVALAMYEVYGMSADEIIARLRKERGAWALSNLNFERLLRAVIDVQQDPQSA